MWTLSGSLADAKNMNVYAKENALACLAEREAWRRRFSLARFSKTRTRTNVTYANAVTPVPENVVYTGKAGETNEYSSDMSPEIDLETEKEKDKLTCGGIDSCVVESNVNGKDNDDDDDNVDDNDDDWSIL